jgi:hypothetical protein
MRFIIPEFLGLRLLKLLRNQVFENSRFRKFKDCRFSGFYCFQVSGLEVSKFKGLGLNISIARKLVTYNFETSILDF